MEPDLWELFEDGQGEDEVAAIVRLGQIGVLPEGVRVITQFGDIVTVRLKRSRVLKLSESAEIAGMAAGWTYFGPDVETEATGLPEAALEFHPGPVDRRPPTDSVP